MNIVRFPVRNVQFTIVMFVMVVALGIVSWLTIPRGEDPPLAFPSFSVVAVLPGASPVDLERLVVKPIEDKLHALEHVEKLQSRMEDGVAVVRVEFFANENPDDRYDEVLREVNALRPTLPPELRKLTVEKSTTLDVAIAQLALVGATVPYATLDSIAERLEDQLTATPGVRTAERFGVPKRQVDVLLDLGRLSRLGIPAGRSTLSPPIASTTRPATWKPAGARSR
jgi:multidrug efflux pump subunit AcrB